MNNIQVSKYCKHIETEHDLIGVICNGWMYGSLVVQYNITNPIPRI